VKVLFAHDHVFRLGDGGEVYSPGQLTYRTWERYLSAFDELEVVARKASAERNAERLNRSDGHRVEFFLDHGFEGPRSYATRKAGWRQALQRRIEAADAVIARVPSELGLVAIECARRCNKPYAVEVVGCAFDAYWNYGSMAARMYAPIMYARMRRAIAAAPFALYVTESFLQRRYPNSGATVAVSNVNLREGDVPAVIRARVERIGCGNHHVLGTIGSLRSRYKGLDTALRALAELRASGLEFELRVLGDGDPGLWKRLAAKIGVAPYVHFDGTLPAGDAVNSWLDGIDIYLQPSRQEGLPRSAIEAMSRGCPVVASTAGGIPELLPSERLHKPGDWRALAALLAQLAQDRTAMTADADRNARQSTKYVARDLDRRRTQFWREFAAVSSRSRATR
jgi:glycosyltransferase involved in cell wall biosynthesis